MARQDLYPGSGPRFPSGYLQNGAQALGHSQWVIVSMVACKSGPGFRCKADIFHLCWIFLALESKVSFQGAGGDLFYESGVPHVEGSQRRALWMVA